MIRMIVTECMHETVFCGVVASYVDHGWVGAEGSSWPLKIPYSHLIMFCI